MATVILFCGLPASGKSSWAKILEDHFQRCKKRTVVHLEYDAFEDRIFSQMCEHEEERRDAWNQARQEAAKELESILQNRYQDSTLPPLLILMDDNFHLRGMRKQIHRLLLNHRPICFGIIWTNIPIEICLERNRLRDRKIPKHVIEKMQSTFEPPRAAWEDYTITIDETTSSESIIEFVENCSEIRDLPETNNPEQKEADRAETLQNQRHTLDKTLRSWVGQVAKHDKKFARRANLARKEVLQRMKEGSIEIETEHSLLDMFLDFVLASSPVTSSDDDSSNTSLRSELKGILTEGL